MPVIGLIEAAAWRTQPWANGAGVTHEIARWGEGAAYDARLSVAELTARSPFSRFAGYDRWLAPDGELTLHLPDGLRRVARGEALAFAGELDVTGEPAVPTWELNVMVRRGVVWSAEIVTGEVERVAAAGVTAVFAFGDRVRAEVAGQRVEVPARTTLLATSSTGFALTVHASEGARAAVVQLGLRAMIVGGA